MNKTKTCASCSKAIVGRPLNKFCSNRCYWNSRWAPIKKRNTIVCKTCGKKFLRRRASSQYCSYSCSGLARRGSKGYINMSGYRVIKIDGKSVMEHRHVMEQILGRPLLPNESVHHKNGHRSDNKPANLELWARKHRSGQRVSDKVKDAIAYLRIHNPSILSRGFRRVS
jgi:HNH endonuclease